MKPYWTKQDSDDLNYIAMALLAAIVLMFLVW